MRSRTISTTTALLLSAAGALAAGGCDWREFDDLKKETPVLSVGSPSGFGESHSFGEIAIAVSPPTDGSAAARFIASAGTKPRLAVVDLDAAGQAHGMNIASQVLSDLESGDHAIAAMAEIPGTRTALLGVPSTTPAQLLRLGLDPPYEVTPFISAPEMQLGIGVAAANIGGGAAPELVAVSQFSLHVYIDGAASGDIAYIDGGMTEPCPLTIPNSVSGRDRAKRAVVVGPLLGAGTQIAVGTPTSTGAGVVSIFNVDLATRTISCAMALRPPQGAVPESLFGRALATGDFDHDGVTDLLVGSPPAGVYLFRGPVTATPTTKIPNPNPVGDTAGDFGMALAAFDLNGALGDEALIGDPSANVGSSVGAGNVHIYTGPALATESGPTLAKHDPSSGDGYGITVAGLSFCPPATPADCTTLPMIGSGAKIFTYFTVGKNDPRVK